MDGLALKDLIAAVHRHIPDATDEEISAAAAMQFAADHVATIGLAGLQLAQLVGWIRKNVKKE